VSATLAALPAGAARDAGVTGGAGLKAARWVLVVVLVLAGVLVAAARRSFRRA
jgi:hypothetical protein